MTEEQMRARITELEGENKKITNDYNDIKGHLETANKTIETHLGTISELKQKNYDLFIQVTTPVSHETQEERKGQEEQSTTVSYDDIINNLMEG